MKQTRWKALTGENLTFHHYQMWVIHLISRVGSISKWPPHWIYFEINAYISHKPDHFAYIKTYQVFLSVANTIEVVSTCSRSLEIETTQCPKRKICFYSFFFLPSCQKVYYSITLSYNKKENIALTRVYLVLRFVDTANNEKAFSVAPAMLI